MHVHYTPIDGRTDGDRPKPNNARKYQILNIVRVRISPKREGRFIVDDSPRPWRNTRICTWWRPSTRILKISRAADTLHTLYWSVFYTRGGERGDGTIFNEKHSFLVDSTVVVEPAELRSRVLDGIDTTPSGIELDSNATRAGGGTGAGDRGGDTFRKGSSMRDDVARSYIITNLLRRRTRTNGKNNNKTVLSARWFFVFFIPNI